MNLDENPTKEELQELLRPCDDERAAHIIYVTKSGDVKIHAVDNESPAEWARENELSVQFRLETCVAGNGYTGDEAADDSNWVNRLYNALLENWQKKNVGYIDNF